MNLQRMYLQFCRDVISAQDGWGGRSMVDHWMKVWKRMAAEFIERESLDRWEEAECNGF